AFLIVLIFISSTQLKAQLSEEDMAKIAQDPIANLISVPFNYSFNPEYGPLGGDQQILKISPVIPFANGKVITRVVIPYVDQPQLLPFGESKSGFSDVNLSVFYTSKEGDFAYGIGPIINLPTAKQGLGSGELGIGPSVVLVYKKHNWVAGILMNLTTSLESAGKTSHLSQIFINYNLSKGYYLTSSPAITANFDAIQRNVWTIPLGMGAGKIVQVGALPLNLQVGAYYNVERPTFANEWSLKASATVLLPTALFKR
ncbi:MAG: hypothetical protein ACMZ7B_07300, partial [Balneola sp.]